MVIFCLYAKHLDSCPIALLIGALIVILPCRTPSWLEPLLCFSACRTVPRESLPGFGLNKSSFAAIASRRSPFFSPEMIFTIAALLALLQCRPCFFIW